MTAVFPTLLSVILVSAISFVGIALFLLKRNALERFLIPLISISTGALLGDVFIHIIPEMAEETEIFANTLLFVLVGIIISFMIEKTVHWRHCHVLPSEQHYHPMGLLNLIGDGIHNFVDGALIAGSFLVSIPVGIATTVAVALHEIPQEIGDCAILLYSGYGKKKVLLFNFLSGCTAIIGAIIILLFSTSLPVVGTYMLPLAAGNFLYIAGADLIPELHKETRLGHAFLQLLSMVGGILLMYGLTFLE